MTVSLSFTSPKPKTTESSDGVDYTNLAIAIAVTFLVTALAVGFLSCIACLLYHQCADHRTQRSKKMLGAVNVSAHIYEETEIKEP